MQDFVRSIFTSALNNCISEGLSSGLSENEIISKLNDQKIQNSFTTLIDNITDECISNVHNDLYECILQRRRNDEHFRAHNKQIWEKGFITSEMMYHIVTDAAGDYQNYFGDLPEEQKEEIQYRYTVISQLHGRACQQFLEILCLLKAGFADGAFARWRSMYELCVIAQFIKQNDERVAKAYYEESFSDNGKCEWAKHASCFANCKRVTFSEIQKQCSEVTEKWEMQYKLSNSVIHSGPGGTFSRLCKPQDSDVVAIGPSDYGLAMPAANSAIVLAIISSIYFTLLHIGDGYVFAKVASVWAGEVRKTYSEIEATCFKNDNE